MPPREDERYQGVEKHSSGFKLLASMGWKEGEGLGAKRQGLKHHIKVRKVQDNAGIGLAEAARKAKDWTVGMAAYDQVLAKLKTVGSTPASDSAAPDAAKIKKRKQPTASAPPLAMGKKKLKSSEEADVPASLETATTTIETATVADSSSHAEGVAKVENAVAARASHTARFGRRRAGKNVRSYSGSDLAAILGENSAPAPSASEAKFPAKEGPRRLVVDLQESISALQECQEEQLEQPDDEQRWWYNIFARSGRLGSSAPKPVPESSTKPKVKITGFSEDDQTSLYNMAHDASGKGRQGLGIASRPKKVAGARWQGTKKQIEESSEDEQAPAAEEEAQPAERADSEDCSEDTHISSREQTQQGGEPEAVEQLPQSGKGLQAAPASEQGVSAKALVKAARRVLGAAPGGQLKQKKLEKRVLDLLEVQRGSSERKQMRRALLAAIESSAKLKTCDGIVSC